MTGLTITALVVALLLMASSVVLVLGSDRLATYLHDRRRLLEDPPKRKVSPVTFRLIGSLVFVFGLIITNMSVGILIFG